MSSFQHSDSKLTWAPRGPWSKVGGNTIPQPWLNPFPAKMDSTILIFIYIPLTILIKFENSSLFNNVSPALLLSPPPFLSPSPVLMDDELYRTLRTRHASRYTSSHYNNYKMASTLFTIGAEAAKIGYSAYKNKKRKMENNMGTGVNVVAVSNHEHRERKGKRKFNRYPSVSKQLKNLNNVITYRWQSWSPYHSNRASIPMINATDFVQGDRSATAYDIKNRILPMYLFDITSAPNVLGKFIPNTATTIQKGTLPVGNYNPCFRFVGSVRQNNNSQFNILMPNTLSVYNDMLTQAPSGALASWNGSAPNSRTGNGWQVQYASKIQTGLITESDAADTANVDGGYVAYGGNAYIQYGIQNNSVNPSAIQRGIVPPVGSKPFHLRTHVKLCMVGANTSPTDFDISLIQLKEDWLAPDNIEWTNTNGGNVPVKQWGANTINQANQGDDIGTKLDDTYAGIARKVWLGLAAPYTLGPDAPIDKSIYKYVRFLGKRTVHINAGTTIDKDAAGNAHYVDLNFEWNTRRHYDWYSGVEQTEILPDVTNNNTLQIEDVGVGFSTKIATSHGNYLAPDPTKRIFLLIRARTPLQSGWIFNNLTEGQSLFQDIGGLGDWGAIQGSTGKDIPSFDIQITNTFIQGAIDG